MLVTTSGFRATENAASRQAVEKLGGTYSQDLTENTEILIMRRAAQNSEKLRAARRLNIKVVTIFWLKASLANNQFQPPEAFLMRPLEGLAIFFGTTEGREEAVRLGARVAGSLEDAELVVCAEIFDPLVEVSRRRGISAFTVKWIFECGLKNEFLETGEFGRISDHLLKANSSESVNLFNPILLGHVISLALIKDDGERKRLRDLARRLGAFTTESMDDAAISILLISDRLPSSSHPAILLKAAWLDRCIELGSLPEISDFEIPVVLQNNLTSKINRTQSFLRGTGEPSKAAPASAVVVPVGPVVARSSLGGSTISGVFWGKKFAVVGFEGPEEQGLIYQLTVNGGEISDHSVNAIVANDGERISTVGVLVVSRRWVRACIEEEKILDVNGNLLFKPSQGKMPLPLVRDVHIFHAEKNDRYGIAIKELCAVLGFKLSEGKNVNVKNITHFVFGSYLAISRRPDLLELAEKWNIKAVTVEWLRKTFLAAARVDETPFLVKKGTQGNIEAFFTERDGADGLLFANKSFAIGEELKDLEEIIKKAGGIVTAKKTHFPDYALSTKTDRDWILECIEQNRVLDRATFIQTPSSVTPKQMPISNKVTWDPTKTPNQLNTPVKQSSKTN